MSTVIRLDYYYYYYYYYYYDDDFSIPYASNCVIIKHLGKFLRDVILPSILSMLFPRRVSYTEQ